MLARCRKFLALITLVAGLVHSSQLLALGLGDLAVNSSLNEPLEATIELLGLDGLTSGQIQARLGSVDEFERANINRDFLIDDIQLEIIILSREQGILRLTSEEPVIEPFLSMVINVGWPTGRLMRDYTALIDLPVFVSDQPQVVPLDVPQTPTPVREETPAPEPQAEVISTAEPVVPAVEEMPESAPAESAQDIAEQENGEAEAESDIEALAEQETAELMVAEEPEPEAEADTGVTEVSGDLVEEVAEEVALFEEPAEPEEAAAVTVESGDTLYDIAASNRLATSVSVEQTMLAIQRANPDAFIDNNINMIRVGQVLRIPSIQEVQSIDQAQALNQIALQNQAVSVQPLAFSANNAATGADSSDELTILSGEDGTDSLSGDNDMAETIAALENQLAISEENLDRARLENAELTARFNELSEQVDILQNIIAMQDERLAQLQADLAARNAEAALAAAAQPVVDTPAQPPQADNSMMGKLSSVFENTLVLVSSLLALILLVVGFLVWRRRAAQDAMDDFDVSSVSSFEEGSKPEASEAEAPLLKDEVKENDLETFDFDLGEVSFEDEQDKGASGQQSDEDIVIEEPDSEDHSLESLAASLGQVDTGDSDDDLDTAVSDDHEFDLGEISLDDSLFEIDDEDEAQETGEEPISDRDEASTKLDLAVAYEAMGDLDGAKEILNEVVAEGNAEQIAEANKLLQKWSAS
jgi:pilus assembly protein FimV